MAAKFIVHFLVASFLLLGTSSSSLWEMECEDFSQGGDVEGEDAVAGAEDVLVITDVVWIDDEEGVSLSVCWNASLGELRQNVTDISLNDTISGCLDGTGRCAIFNTPNHDFKLSSDPTKYTVDVQLSDGSSMRGSATFAMTVVTTLLDCEESHFTKVSWTNETTQLLNLTCIEEPLPFDSSCYCIGDISHQELCFTVPNEEDLLGENITVCLVGPTDYTANITSDEGFSVNYLQYGEIDGVSPDLSLTFNKTVDAVIVVTNDSRSTVHHCYNNRCPLQEQFEPSTNRYEVCADLDNVQTATTTFHDLQVTILEAAEDELSLKFVFANSLPSKIYSTSLLRQVPSNGSVFISSNVIDCTKVQAGHGCFGWLVINSTNETAYLAVANNDDGTNQVIVPYNTHVATTKEMTPLTEQYINNNNSIGL